MRSLMRRDLRPYLAVSVGPKSGETSYIVVYPITHQRTGMLAAPLLFVLVTGRHGYRLPQHAVANTRLETSRGYDIVANGPSQLPAMLIQREELRTRWCRA